MKKFRIALVAMLVLLVATSAFALTAPVAGDFMFELYDFAVNTLLNGAVGIVGGMLAFAAAAILAIRQMIIPAVGTALAGIFLLNADSLIGALGAIIC